MSLLLSLSVILFCLFRPGFLTYSHALKLYGPNSVWSVPARSAWGVSATASSPRLTLGLVRQPVRVCMVRASHRGGRSDQGRCVRARLADRSEASTWHWGRVLGKVLAAVRAAARSALAAAASRHLWLVQRRRWLLGLPRLPVRPGFYTVLLEARFGVITDLP